MCKNSDQVRLAILAICLSSVVGFPSSPPISSGLRESYDFIIVGGGTAGNVVTGRLSQSGQFSVLLLEAGGVPHPGLDVPGLVPHYLVDGGYTKLYQTVPQQNVALDNNGVVNYMAGWTLGGGSSVNGMVFNRGSPHDFNLWANLTGDGSWNYRSLLYNFKEIENYTGNFPSPQHGYEGPITISRPSYAPGLDTIYFAARSLGYPISDTNGPQMPTFAPTEFTKRNGRRVSSYTGYVKPYLRSRKNLKVATYSSVKRIIFEGDKAIGVVFQDKSGNEYFIRSNREIILSAGALETPALLMKSGIGPKNILRQNRIELVKELPSGKFFQDHVGIRLEFVINDKLPKQVFIAERELTPEAFALFNKTGEGPYSSYDGLHTQALLASPQAIRNGEGDWADIQIEFVSGPGRSDVPGLVGSRHKAGGREGLEKWQTTVFCLVFLTRPKSRGMITLNKADIDSDPVIDPRYLTEKEDMDTMIDGIKMALEVYEKTPAFQKLGARYRPAELEPCKHMKFRSDRYWRCVVRETAEAGLRGSGSCRMGQIGDKNAVVDTQLKVMGIEGLRIADGSIMPRITNANTEAPILAIGEKAAEMVLKRWEEIEGRKPPRWGRKGPWETTYEVKLG